MKARCAAESGTDALLGAAWLRLYRTLGVTDE